MTSEGEGTKRTRSGDAAIPMEDLPKRVRFSSGKLLWAKLVKEHIAEESRSAAMKQAKVYKCLLVVRHKHTMRTSGRRHGRLGI
jgi:hypothetical protein